jgi:hypothetical protein
MSINSRTLSEALSSKPKLTNARYLLLLVVLAAGLSAEVSPAVSNLPSNQQVLAFLSESIDWYRYCAIERQVATEPGDLVFLEDNRPVAAQIVRLSFDFARADASIQATSPAGTRKESSAIATGSSPDITKFIQLESNAELQERKANQEIEAIKKSLQTASDADRRKLRAALHAAQSRLEVLQAGSATLHQLVEFMRAPAGRETGDLASNIDDLARTVPDVTSPTAVESQTQNSAPSLPAQPENSGILALSSKVSALGRKLNLLDDEIRRIDKLRQSSDDLRGPLFASIVNRYQASAGNDLQASDVRALQQQKAGLDELAALVKSLSPAIVALDRQSVLLSAYASRLKSWRAAVITEDRKTWKTLISRLVAAAVFIGALVMIGAVVRRTTRRHVHDAERRHIMLIIQRVVVWFAIVVVAAIAFASDWATSATFFGLLAAGVAVALQSVIIAALGYFLLVGRRGIRIGDRVEISGVIGDVNDIGWLQFQLSEIDRETQQPTGRVVTFSNSFVFLSPATGLSKFNREDVKPAQLEAAAKAPQS